MNTMRFKIARLAATVMFAISTFAVFGTVSDYASASPAAITGGFADHDHSKSDPMKTIAFHDAMRKLWEDHITWTRMFIVSALADLPDTGDAAGRLLQNQADIGDAIKPFYGEAAGEQLTALLRDHILIAADLVAAAKAGDAAGIEAASARWYANADDIATFLSSANPENWPLDEMKAMMREHLDLTLQEAVARLTGNWAADIATYDEIHEQILEMADMLSTGIIRQFPKQFK